MKKEFLKSIELSYTWILDEKAMLYSSLTRAMDTHPENVELQDWMKRADELFRETAFEDDSMTQFFNSPTVLRSVDEAIERSKERKQFDTSDIPSFSLNLTQDINGALVNIVEKDHIEDNLTSLEVAREKPVEQIARVKRTVKVASPLRSPYVNRVVDSSMNLNATERQIANYIWTMNRDAMDEIFMTDKHQVSIRLMFESLAPNVYIYANIIDSWSAILNHEEQYKSKDSPSRLFFHTTILTDDMVNEKMSEEQRYKQFETNMIEFMQRKEGLKILNNFDLVRTICKINYGKSTCAYHPTFEIIDNMSLKIEMDAKYGVRPMVLRCLFVRCLQKAGHKKSQKMLTTIPQRLKMRWRTKDNMVDCGVFLMRHMETYKGKGVKDWDCALATESPKQKRQLNILRVKYGAKILLSDINLHRQRVIDEMEELDKIADKEKEEIIKNGLARREERFKMIN